MRERICFQEANNFECKISKHNIASSAKRNVSGT